MSVRDRRVILGPILTQRTRIREDQRKTIPGGELNLGWSLCF